MKAKRRTKKRGVTKTRRRRGLLGMSVSSPSKMQKVGMAAKEGGLMLVAALIGGIGGAAIGKPSLLVGLPTTMIGAYYGNKYAISAGLGMCLANGFQQNNAVNGVDEPINGDDEMFGFSADEIKGRVSTYFKNFSEKLFITPAAPAAVGSLNDIEQPAYFINPYSQAANGFAGSIDMSELDRVQAQVAQMSGYSLEGDEREF